MSTSLSPADIAKRAAAERAHDMVEGGMTRGLGTRSTAAWFVRLLSVRMKYEGLEVVGVATSSTTSWLAEERGVTLRALDASAPIDLIVDGADEFDADLNLIKGGGAALLQEKIVASAAGRMVVVADPGKQVAQLGAFPLPVEVVRFGWPVTTVAVERVLAGMDVAGRDVSVRMGKDGPLVTDEGHHIFDLHLGCIRDPARLSVALNSLPGVVEHGLFSGRADTVIVGRENGAAEVINRRLVPDALDLMRDEDA
jgi:ribose 5-phosphate isomerase A